MKFSRHTQTLIDAVPVAQMLWQFAPEHERTQREADYLNAYAASVCAQMMEMFQPIEEVEEETES